MSISLLPGIGELDPGSLTYAIYTQLYQHFFNAQDAGSVLEGDVTSIRLRNTAYGFAEAIAGGVTGEGGATDGGVLAGYLKRTGGQMSGLLGADYGFTAGIDNHRVLEVFGIPHVDALADASGYDFGVRILGDVMIEGGSLYLGGRDILSYDAERDTLLFRNPRIDIAASSIQCRGEMYFGEDKTRGLYLSSTTLRMAGHEVYHAGNAGHAAADWMMKDATVCGTLNVGGSVRMNGSLAALQGIELGSGGSALLKITDVAVHLSADIDMQGYYAIRFGGHPALSLSGAKDLRISARGDLLLGAEPTSRVRLMTPLVDELGMRTLITPTGSAWFPDSLRVGHSFGGDLLSTYRMDAQDQGVIIHERLRFGGKGDAYMWGIDGQWGFCSLSDHTAQPGGQLHEVITIMGHIPSKSLLAPYNRASDTFAISTQADFIYLGNRVEADISLGIAGALTRLEKGCLFLNDVQRLQSVAGGIKHYGHALFVEGISSETFSSGLAGSGWSVLTNRTTGHAEAAFDTLTVRRRMRVYELEVQRARTTNGALWISDACSGDSVEKLL